MLTRGDCGVAYLEAAPATTRSGRDVLSEPPWHESSASIRLGRCDFLKQGLVHVSSNGRSREARTAQDKRRAWASRLIHLQGTRSSMRALQASKHPQTPSPKQLSSSPWAGPGGKTACSLPGRPERRLPLTWFPAGWEGDGCMQSARASAEAKGHDKDAGPQYRTSDTTASEGSPWLVPWSSRQYARKGQDTALRYAELVQREAGPQAKPTFRRLASHVAMA